MGSWRQHAAPYLRAALKKASKTWKPKSKRPNERKIKALQQRRASINEQIKKERSK